MLPEPDHKLCKYNSIINCNSKCQDEGIKLENYANIGASQGKAGRNPNEHSHEVTTESVHSQMTPCGKDIRKMSLETETLEAPHNEQSIQSERQPGHGKVKKPSSKSEFV